MSSDLLLQCMLRTIITGTATKKCMGNIQKVKAWTTDYLTIIPHWPATLAFDLVLLRTTFPPSIAQNTKQLPSPLNMVFPNTVDKTVLNYYQPITAMLRLTLNGDFHPAVHWECVHREQLTAPWWIWHSVK